MNRIDARAKDQIRTVLLTDEFLRSPEGSVLIEVGNTKVICTAMVENSTARHLTGTGYERSVTRVVSRTAAVWKFSA